MKLSTEQLKEAAKRRLSPKRARHTLEVAKEALLLADFFPLSAEEKEGLCHAALLHDITKEEPLEAQTARIRAHGLRPSEDDLRSPQTLHALSGYVCALSEFSLPEKYALCIRRHSTGGGQMTLLDKLLFCADYTEATRPYENCKRLRAFLHSELEEHENCEERLAILNEGVYNIANATLEHLIRRHCFIHPDTLALRNTLIPPTKGKEK